MKKLRIGKGVLSFLLAALMLLSCIACDSGQGTPTMTDGPSESLPKDSESQASSEDLPHDLNQLMDKSSDELRLYVASSTDAKQDGFVFLYKDEIWLHDSGFDDRSEGSVYEYLINLRLSLLPKGVKASDTDYKLRINVILSHFHSDHVDALYKKILPSGFFTVDTLYCSAMSDYENTEFFKQTGESSYTDGTNGKGRGSVLSALERYSPNAQWVEVPFGEMRKVTSADGKLVFELFASARDWGTQENAEIICNDYYDGDTKHDKISTAISNANSMWTKVIYGDRTMLFTGDTMKKLSHSYAKDQEGYMEEAFDVMLEHYASMCGAGVFDVDLLKYPHHGQSRSRAMRGVIEVMTPDVMLFTAIDYQSTTLDKTMHWLRYKGAFCANDTPKGFLVTTDGKSLRLCKNSVWVEQSTVAIYDASGKRTAFVGQVGAAEGEGGTPEADLPTYTMESLAQAFAIQQPSIKVPAANAVIWNGEIADGFASGSGTKNDPYLIANGAELAYLAHLVNAGDSGATKGKYYKLTADIYLNDVTDISMWATSPSEVPAGVNVWTPIGVGADCAADGKEHAFSGVLDGAGYTVFGIYTLPDQKYGGLFGMINGYGATVASLKDILDCGMEGLGAGVRDLTIAYSMVSGSYRVGAVVGFASCAYFYRCTVDPTVITIHVGGVKEDGDVGGMVGRCIGWIEECVNSARVTGVITLSGTEAYYPNFAGGLGGILIGYVGKSANFGDVDVASVGGLFSAYLGGNSIATLVSDSYCEGTLGDMWESNRIDESARKKLVRVGLFTARTAHVKSELGYTVQRCVSAGNYSLNPANVKAMGIVAAAAHKSDCVLGLAYVDYGFPESMELTGDWKGTDEYLFYSIFRLSPDELAVHRAATEKEDEEA